MGSFHVTLFDKSEWQKVSTRRPGAFCSYSPDCSLLAQAASKPQLESLKGSLVFLGSGSEESQKQRGGLETAVVTLDIYFGMTQMSSAARTPKLVSWQVS